MVTYCADSSCYAETQADAKYCEKHSCCGGELTLYYWPVLGRANASMRMLAESKTPYTQKTDFADIAQVCSGYGAKVDTYAPPVLKDGDTLISQSIPITVHVGKRTGFDRGIPCPLKALQYLLDGADFMAAVQPAFKSGASLKGFMTAPGEGKLSHCDEWLNHFEGCIQGPYYFGDRATYVDFYLAMVFDVLNFMVFDAIGCPLTNYPKIKGVLAAIRGLESAKSVPSFPVCPREMCATEEVIAEYKA